MAAVHESGKKNKLAAETEAGVEHFTQLGVFEEDQNWQEVAAKDEVASSFSLFSHLWPVYKLYQLVQQYAVPGFSGASLNGRFTLEVIKEWRLENPQEAEELQLSNLTILDYVGTLFNTVMSALNKPNTSGDTK